MEIFGVFFSSLLSGLPGVVVTQSEGLSEVVVSEASEVVVSTDSDSEGSLDSDSDGSSEGSTLLESLGSSDSQTSLDSVVEDCSVVFLPPPGFSGFSEVLDVEVSGFSVSSFGVVVTQSEGLSEVVVSEASEVVVSTDSDSEGSLDSDSDGSSEGSTLLESLGSSDSQTSLDSVVEDCSVVPLPPPGATSVEVVGEVVVSLGP